MPFSHHSHSGQFCSHATGTLEEVVIEAIRQRFQLYGLTEHVPRYRQQDLYPEEASQSLDALVDQFNKFVSEAHRLKDLYANDITLLVGLETEYISPLDLDRLRDVLHNHNSRIEYLVGSLHHVNGIPIDFDLETYKRALASFPTEETRMDDFLSSYFDAQYEILEQFHPEIIGHVDLCRLYQPDLSLESWPRAWEKLRRNIQFAVDYGAIFELNAAALRKGWSSSYPGEDVLIQQYDGRFTLSDDSHGPHAVGLNYSRMREYIVRVGIKELWVLERSDAPNVGGRYTRPRKVEPNILASEFWETATNAS
ncbi:Polymerase/histidinol phosphatase-like protein [Cristinia sonorae]|uniref:Histidinol-phosphatase n=1 Tax=Cristinia sonorae TaxID=1940300 RepID=A0A8K0XKA7_9AGAR|nr:Polymerase/histidinol phosphatase-like protein [Cristinia sonorae]